MSESVPLHGVVVRPGPHAELRFVRGELRSFLELRLHRPLTRVEAARYEALSRREVELLGLPAA